MYKVYVNNYIDYLGSFQTTNPMLAVMWAIAALSGPCRSGAADIVYDPRM